MDSPPSRVDDRAQSSPIGIVLILGITLTGAVGLAVFGGAALDDAQQDSRVGQAEQSMTQFDSQAAQVALGESNSQRVQFGTNSGQYSVDEDAGNVRLIHKNWNESNATDHEYEIYNASLGAVVYESDDSELAYQGGGVWRTDDDGDAQLVSPPEFHYRRATLTFPIVRVSGDGSVSGSANAGISRVETAEQIFANESETYPDGSTKLLNPVQNGNMTVEITSRYCEGWRNYFQDRTDGTVSECDSDGTVTAQLVTLGTQGEFNVLDGQELNIRGMESGHSLDQLELTFKDSTKQNSEFNNFGWSMYGEDDKGTEIEIYVGASGGGKFDCAAGETRTARVIFYYSPNGGEDYHTWVNDESHGDGDFEISCNANDEPELTVDLTTTSVNFTYMDYDTLGGKYDLQSDPSGDFNTTISFSEHSDDDASITYPNDRTQESVALPVKHYFAMSDDLDMSINEQNSANMGDDSQGVIQYEGNGEVVTFLHVTDNRIRVELG
ncbi:hypothetical protein KY092_06315 [Natronomonas gomsonensis]|uniref:DUF7289 family protein n=1 Tax=Natronomonas gomsonensis TaxID=1046043 RepID=UPI0020CA5349|nr:hypothetical protein [Natronomonas gomsonensis]MCY4730167.1 hypothetical protein [Natronomonas gomsonensis]